MKLLYIYICRNKPESLFLIAKKKKYTYLFISYFNFFLLNNIFFFYSFINLMSHFDIYDLYKQIIFLIKAS